MAPAGRNDLGDSGHDDDTAAPDPESLASDVAAHRCDGLTNRGVQAGLRRMVARVSEQHC